MTTSGRPVAVNYLTNSGSLAKAWTVTYTFGGVSTVVGTCLIYHPKPHTRAHPPEVSPAILLSSCDPLGHQFHPVFLRFQTSHRALVLARDLGEELNGKFPKSRILACVVHGVGDPFVLLGRHVCGGEDPLCRIDQEKDEDLAVTGFGGIFQAEWLDLVLVQVWERDGSVGFGDHIADNLHTRSVAETPVPQFSGVGE